MTNTTTTEHTVTACPAHGEKVTADRPSFIYYVECALACNILRTLGVENHDDGLDCWVCCDQMVIDPYGELDH